jgi:1,4-dihydroxy-2-naphthoate octaprenyltransferase
MTDTGTRSRVGAYARLAKLAFFDFYLSGLVAWTLVAPDDRSDERNYDPRQGALRDRRRKPLLVGHLSVTQAVRFGYASTASAIFFLACALAAAPRRPAAAVALMVLVLVASIQYSYGLKLSYRGAQEFILLMSPALTVLIPALLLRDDVGSVVVVEAFLFGVWSLLISVYSNVNDIAGDRAAGRRNMATIASPGAYRVFVAALTLVEATVVLAAAATAAVSWWVPLFLAPELVVRGRQLHVGLGGGALAARRLGITALRLGVAGLVIANLVSVA